jgi:predicted acetyltransferase
MNSDGHDNFNIEMLLICDLKETGYYENYFIEYMESMKDEIGYNTMCGSNVDHRLNHSKRKIVMTDEIRQKLSKYKDKLLNINEVTYKDKLVGYRVRIVFEGKLIEKKFSSKAFTVEENLKKAKDYLECIKTKKDVSNIRLNNKSNDCPTNIFPKYKKGIHIGYEINITIKGKKYTKSFCSIKIDMNKKLEMAIEYKKNILK